MEREVFRTGYCRQLDGSRTVEILICDGALSEVDCCYGSCSFQGNCPIAKEIEQLNNE